MPAVYTEAMAGRGETCRWTSAAAGASGDRVLASIHCVTIKPDGAGRKRWCDLSVFPVFSVPFARWRYARVTVSNAFDQGQHDMLRPHPNAISEGISLRHTIPCYSNFSSNANKTDILVSIFL